MQNSVGVGQCGEGATTGELQCLFKGGRTCVHQEVTTCTTLMSIPELLLYIFWSA